MSTSGGGLRRLGRVAPKNRGASLRRDHGVDGVLLHQDSIGERRRDRASGPTLADDAGDDWDSEARHCRLRARDRAALAVLLGGDSRIGARNIDQRHERKSVAVGKLHQPHRLAVSLRVRHSEVARRALLDVATLLVSDQGDRAPVEAPEPGHDRRVVGASAVAVQLHPVLKQPLHVVERVRTVLVARKLDLRPDLLVGRLGAEVLELALQALELAGELGPPEQAHAAQLAEPLAQPELVLTGHFRTAGGGGRDRGGALSAGRSGRRGRSGSSTRRARSRREASPWSSAGPLGGP